MEYFFDNLYEEKSLLQLFVRKTDIKKYLILSKCECIYSRRHNRIKFETENHTINLQLINVYVTIKYNAALKYDKTPIRNTNLIANVSCRIPVGKGNRVVAIAGKSIAIVGYDYKIPELLEAIDVTLQEYYAQVKIIDNHT